MAPLPHPKGLLAQGPRTRAVYWGWAEVSGSDVELSCDDLRRRSSCGIFARDRTPKVLLQGVSPEAEPSRFDVKEGGHPWVEDVGVPVVHC